MLKRTGPAPAEAGVALCREIVEQNLAANSMWCILPLQDWLSLDEKLRRANAADERINVPAIPRHYWRYRMHLDIESLLGADAFNRTVRDLVRSAGRGPAHLTGAVTAPPQTT
jgi:4-alpha-glucanotransferase